MKKILLTLSTLLVLSIPVMAQRVTVDNFDQLKVHFSTPEVRISNGEYLTLNVDGYLPGGEVGAPALPVLGNLIVVPFCSGMEVLVENAVYDTLTLPTGRVMPLQPSRCKSHETEPFALDENVYSTDAYYGRPLAVATSLGIGRDRNYAVLSWSPVSVNPVSGTMIVCRSADVTVRYLGSDASATLKHYDRYHTPAFALGETLNTLVYSTKDARTTAPVRMVVVAPSAMQCTALDEFVAWKRQQGMLVDLVFVDNVTAQSVANMFQQMYDEASDEAPAPTYILLVGDNSNMPAFPSNLTSNNMMHMGYYQLDDHVTDLYFATWTEGDKLPDCYQGRFSATDTATLRAIIEKTLYYERYQFLGEFVDDSYLGRAVLVAGVDQSWYVDVNDNAYKYADPTMDYLAYMYINASHGYDSVIYYKNNVDHAPNGVTVTGSNRASGVANTLRSLYNGGVGWINYSAHGNWNEWSIPEFKVNHVNQMTNNGMPSFMIGNCCLSNKFDEGVCFGEALLRKGGLAGAVGYIGATNSTFWGEDFYWSVGVRNDITNDMTPTYSDTRLGAYDRLFHSHGEVLEKWAATAGQMLMAGNMSVNRQTGTSQWATSVAEYYWEIYELMGDPSLMPWIGTAKALTISVINNQDVMDVTAVPGAYVTLVSDGSLTLLASAFAGTDGVAHLAKPAVDLDTVSISVTAQGYRPYLAAYNSHNAGVRDVAATDITVSPNPAGAATEVAAEGLRRVTLLNVMGQALQTVAADADRCRLDLTALPAGLYLLRVETATGIAIEKVVRN